MRPQKVDDVNLLKSMLNVFRSKGYDGASLNELAQSSGLKKASLYHRYPKGKKEIASSILNYVKDSIQKDIHNILVDQSIDTNERLDKVLQNIDHFYNGGEATCIIRSMTLDSSSALFEEEIKSAIGEWINGFVFIGNEIGFNEIESLQKAHETIVLIQGSLVLSKSIQDTSPFKKALLTIKSIYKS